MREYTNPENDGIARPVDMLAEFLSTRQRQRDLPLAEQIRRAAAEGDELAKKLLARGHLDGLGDFEIKHNVAR